MKILLLTTHLRMGGVPVYAADLASALKRRGHDVFVASGGGELVKRLQAENVPHTAVNVDTKSELNPKLLGAIRVLSRFIKDNKIEVIHTHTRVTQVVAERLSRKTGVKHVSTCHGFFKPRIGRLLFGCWGKKVIAISEAVRRHLIDDFKVDPKRVVLINTGIDSEKFKAKSAKPKSEIKKELGLKEAPVVGIIARLSSVKGHKFLISAMQKVIEKNKSAQLLIVGEGGEEAGLKDLAHKLGIADSVIFKKTVLDTRGPLSVMDVFVLSSVAEGLGLSILEAQAAGVPVAASDVGGISSIIKDGVTGLLVPPKDPDKLADAILKLLADKGLAARLAAAGQKSVRENFSIEDMVKKVEAVYQEVLAS